MAGRTGELFYHVFDVLFAGGRDVRSLPIEQRRDVLDGLSRWRDPLRTTQQIAGDGAALLADACRAGWKGLIAKRLGAPYASRRSRDWLKLKCTRAQELVIGGFTARQDRAPTSAPCRRSLRGGPISLCRQGGDGLHARDAARAVQRLAPIVRDTSPSSPKRAFRRAATWVEPELWRRSRVMEWTPDGRLRHPSFLGLRFDKPAGEVVREEP